MPVLGGGALVQMMQLDVVVDGSRQILCDLAVPDLGSGLGRRDVVLKGRDDHDVAVILLQGLDGVLGRTQSRPLDDEGAIIAQEHVNIRRRPHLGIAHGEGQVGPDKQHDPCSYKRAVQGLDAAQDVVELLVQALEDIGSACVDRATGLVAAQSLPVVDHGVAVCLLNG